MEARVPQFTQPKTEICWDFLREMLLETHISDPVFTPIPMSIPAYYRCVCVLYTYIYIDRYPSAEPTAAICVCAYVYMYLFNVACKKPSHLIGRNHPAHWCWTWLKWPVKSVNGIWFSYTWGSWENRQKNRLQRQVGKENTHGNRWHRNQTPRASDNICWVYLLGRFRIITVVTSAAEEPPRCQIEATDHEPGDSNHESLRKQHEIQKSSIDAPGVNTNQKK